MLRREVRRGWPPEVSSGIDSAIRIESAKTASNRRPNQCTTLVASMVSCGYRPRPGLALRIRVVRWEEPFLLGARPGKSRADCAGVRRCCSLGSLRHPRAKMASHLDFLVLCGFCRGI